MKEFYVPIDENEYERLNQILKRIFGYVNRNLDKLNPMMGARGWQFNTNMSCLQPEPSVLVRPENVKIYLPLLKDYKQIQRVTEQAKREFTGG